MLNRTKFIITSSMRNGDKWETVRHTKEGLSEYIQNILGDGEVVSFSVEEKIYA